MTPKLPVAKAKRITNPYNDAGISNDRILIAGVHRRAFVQPNSWKEGINQPDAVVPFAQARACAEAGAST